MSRRKKLSVERFQKSPHFRSQTSMKNKIFQLKIHGKNNTCRVRDSNSWKSRFAFRLSIATTSRKINAFFVNDSLFCPSWERKKRRFWVFMRFGFMRNRAAECVGFEEKPMERRRKLASQFTEDDESFRHSVFDINNVCSKHSDTVIENDHFFYLKIL